MSKPPIKSLDEDITSTLSKLYTILQYSTDPNADEVLALVEKAKTIWEGEGTEDLSLIHI
jgi:hypothetical protein